MYRSMTFVLGFLLSSSVAFATEQEEAIIAHPGVFNFSPPGARALGMGATFIAIADDATASESNPAGLTLLTQREASVHFRATSTETEAEDPFDNFFSRTESFGNSVVSPSFLSYVEPLRGATISVYYNRAADFESHEAFDGGPLNESLFEFDSQLDVFGLSGAVRIGSFVSIGASLRYSRLELEMSNRFVGFPLEVFEEPTALLRDELVDDTAEELTFNVGLLVNPSGRFSFGLVYKQGAEFGLDASQFLVIANSAAALVLNDRSSANSNFAIPDVWGAGIAYRPSSRWVIGLDVVRVTYSDIQATRFSRQEFGNPEGPQDETEIHLGFEYGFTVGSNDTPVFIRAGSYNNPDHDGTSLIDSEQNFVTFGGGVFIDDKFQLDAAVSTSQDTFEAIVSFGWRL